MANVPARCRVQELEVEVAVLKTRISERDYALTLQAKEYERRLDALNHEHARVAEAQASYVSRDTWDAFQAEHKMLMERQSLVASQFMSKELAERRWDENREWREKVEKEMAENRGGKATLIAIVGAVVGLAGFIGSVLNYILHP